MVSTLERFWDATRDVVFVSHAMYESREYRTMEIWEIRESLEAKRFMSIKTAMLLMAVYASTYMTVYVTRSIPIVCYFGRIVSWVTQIACISAGVFLFIVFGTSYPIEWFSVSLHDLG